MKKILLSVCGLLLGLTAGAQSLDYLTFRTLDGTEASLPVDGLKITFAGNQLHAEAQQQKVELLLSEMGLMFFAELPTAIEEVESSAEKVAIINGHLVGSAAQQAEVYALDGRQIEGNNIPKGVYLVKMNGRTYKVMAR